MSEYFGIIATAPSGSTATMELVSGRVYAAERIASLVESDHTVRLFKCTPVDFEVCQVATIYIAGESR